MAEDPTQATKTTEVKVKAKKPIYKRVWFWVIVVLVVVVVFGGSGSDDEDEASSTTDETVAESTETADDEEADEDDEEGDEADDATDDEEEADDDVLELADFEEIVVVDNDYCSITITGIDPDGIFGYELDVTLVNKSSDTTYMFASSDGAVDGVQTDPLFAEEVAAGKTAYSTVYIYDADDLEDIGVAFTDIVLYFRVYDSDDWTADEVAETTVHVYPYGEEAATTFVREAADDDIVLVDNDYVTVTVIGYDPDYLYGYAIELYVVNKTDTTIMVSTDEESVNGVMCDPYFAASVGAGRVSYETLYWFSSTLEDAGIEDPGSEISSIEFELRVYDYDDWTVDDFVDEVITLNP